MADNDEKATSEQRIKKLKEAVEKKNLELKLEQEKLEKAEKQRNEEEIAAAIKKRQEELEDSFDANEDIKNNDDISSLLLQDEKDLESKLQGIKEQSQEIMSMYMSATSPTENIYNDLKTLYIQAQQGGVTPEMAEIAGNAAYALQQKYDDVQSGDYNASNELGQQANTAQILADKILSVYTGFAKKKDTRLI